MEWLLSKAVYGIASFYLMMRKVYLSKNKMGLKRAKRLVKMIRPKNVKYFYAATGSRSALKLFAIHMIRRKGGGSGGGKLGIIKMKRTTHFKHRDWSVHSQCTISMTSNCSLEPCKECRLIEDDNFPKNGVPESGKEPRRLLRSILLPFCLL